MNELQITQETNNPLGILMVKTFNEIIIGLNNGSIANMATKTITLALGTGQIELGSTFTPPIIKRPNLYNAMKIAIDGSGTDFTFVIKGFAPNADGIHWDIAFEDSEEEITDLVINVQ